MLTEESAAKMVEEVVDCVFMARETRAATGQDPVSSLPEIVGRTMSTQSITDIFTSWLQADPRHRRTDVKSLVAEVTAQLHGVHWFHVAMLSQLVDLLESHGVDANELLTAMTRSQDSGGSK